MSHRFITSLLILINRTFGVQALERDAKDNAAELAQDVAVRDE